MNTQYEREMDDLDKQLAEGFITNSQYRRYVRELNEDMRGYAEEQAERAYNDVMGW